MRSGPPAPSPAAAARGGAGRGGAGRGGAGRGGATDVLVLLCPVSSEFQRHFKDIGLVLCSRCFFARDPVCRTVGLVQFEDGPGGSHCREEKAAVLSVRCVPHARLHSATLSVSMDSRTSISPI